MGAVSVGTESSTKNTAGERSTPPKSSAPATVVKWIPGEAITFYAALIGVGTAQGALTGNESPEELLERIDAGSPAWFLVGVGIAVVLVLLGAISGQDDDKKFSVRSLLVRVVLTVASFVLWTTALPGSWPYDWTFIRDLGPAYALLLVPLGIMFSTVAEYTTRRLEL